MFKEIRDLRHITNFNRVIMPISVAFFVYTFGWGVTSPMFSIFVNGVTGNPFLTGLILSLTTMGGIFLNVPFGILEDRLNIKRVLQLVLLVYAVLALIYPEASTFATLLLVSVVRGIASSLLWLSSWAYVFTYTDKAVKGKETGFFSEMNDLASALSPAVGGLITVVSFFLPFYVLSLMSMTAFAIVTTFVKEVPKPEKIPLEAQLRKLSTYMRSSRFVKTILLIVIFYALVNVYYSFLSVFLNGEGISVTLIGIVLTVALVPAVGLEVPLGSLMDRVGIRETLLVATASTAITGLLMPLSSDILYVFALVTAFTVSYTAIFIALYSKMSDTMREDKVVMTGAIATFKDLGYTMGPLAAGLLTQVAGIRSTFFITGAAFALLLPIAATLRD